MTMHKALHHRDDVDRIYVSRKGERGPVSNEESVDATIQRFEDYIKKKRRRRLITNTRNNTNNSRINIIETTRKQEWEEKQLYGYFKRKTSGISNKTWTWLKKGDHKRETEFPLITAQNNAIRTNMKARIDKTQQISKCRFCDDRDKNDQSHIQRMLQISSERV